MNVASCAVGYMTVCGPALLKYSCLCASSVVVCVGDARFAIATNVVVTCEIKLYQNYFSLRRRPSLRSFYFSAWKLAWNYFTDSLQFI